MNKINLQEKHVMEIMRSNTGTILTPRHIWAIYRKSYKYAELTSIRRAITDLVQAGSLEYEKEMYQNGLSIGYQYKIHQFNCPVKTTFKTHGRIVVIK